MYSVVLLNRKHKILKEIVVEHIPNADGEDITENHSIELARSWCDKIRNGFDSCPKNRASRFKYIISVIVYTSQKHRAFRCLASFPCWQNIK